MKTKTEKLIEAICSVLELKFPNIQNLEVIADAEFGASIKFSEGQYSKEEVQRFLDVELREEVNNICWPTDFEKCAFGLIAKKPNLKPILFSTPMVKSILNGSKTQTRRKIKSTEPLTEYEGVLENRQFPFWKEEMLGKHLFHTEHGEHLVRPKCEVGDVFWVRETTSEIRVPRNNVTDDEIVTYVYKTDEKPPVLKWKPSIFMPKEACRLFLKVTNVRVERLHDISEEDAISEGVKSASCETTEGCIACKSVCQAEGTYWDYMNPSGECGFPCDTAKDSFESLWLSINGKESWDSNPYVFVYDFEKTEKPKNFL